MLKLIRGLHEFRTQIHSQNEAFFNQLAQHQAPHALFICCSDSRVDPNLITQTDPGDLFTLRNAGNIVPPYDGTVRGEEATIEYAVVALGIKDIVVCGHSNCGAMKGLLNKDQLGDMPTVKKWLDHSNDTLDVIARNYAGLDELSLWNIAIQENVLVQLEHLRTLPAVNRALWKRELELHGWIYKIETGEVFVYDPIYEQFLPIHLVQGELHLVPPEEKLDECAEVT